MRCDLRLIFFVAVASYMVSCASNSVERNDGPLDAYQKAIRSGDGTSGGYSAEYLKSRAAMYLLSQGGTELKAGNSAQATRLLFQARELNPWNDDIKDTYLIAVRFLVKSTVAMDDESCELILDRLALINSVAQDQMKTVSKLSKKCDFGEVKNQIPTFKNILMSKSAITSERAVFRSFDDEIESVLAKNKYVPKKELLDLSLSYMGGLKFALGQPDISGDSDDSQKIKVLVPIKAHFSGEFNSREYCHRLQGLLENKKWSEQIASMNIKPNEGFISCRHLHGLKNVEFYTTPSWIPELQDVLLLPDKLVLCLTFNYKNGQKRSFYEVVGTHMQPDFVETSRGFRFDFQEGDLPLRLQGEEHFKNNGDVLELTVAKPILIGLTDVEMNIDLSRTFSLNMDNKSKSADVE